MTTAWDDFRIERIDTGEAQLGVHVGGEGPPLAIGLISWKDSVDHIGDPTFVLSSESRGGPIRKTAVSVWAMNIAQNKLLFARGGSFDSAPH